MRRTRTNPEKKRDDLAVSRGHYIRGQLSKIKPRAITKKPYRPAKLLQGHDTDGE